MKILIASDLYWPTINGVATFSRNLAIGLAKNGHEVMVIAPSQTGKKQRETDENYEIVRTASIPFTFYQNFKISLNPYRDVKKVIDEFQPDVIHIQMLMMIGQATMKYGHKCGIPIVTTNHAMPENLLDNLKLLAPFAKPISYMLKAYGMRFHSKADYVTMPTQAAIDMFVDDAKNLDVPLEAVSNGIDLSRFKPTPAPKTTFEKFKLPNDVPIIYYVGRLDGEKHVSVLIRAFVRVMSARKVHLMLVGDGTDVENLKSLARELGVLRDITFTGRVKYEGEDLVNLHKAGTVFCMPSPAELQSIAMLEAMASGKPVVAVDAGALKELCQNERNGYLCEQDNDEQIANGLLNIISDPKLREKMSKESLAIAHTHDIERTIERFEEIYSSLINTYN
ncbi:MAG: glycosyltransferase [Candidatus Saccharimonadaceae bacterium]|nr:glycosyltransferase [Candidatus Saccharimonadaceae bacterium]